MSAHTPGPWIVGTLTGHNANIVYGPPSSPDDYSEDSICSVYGLPMHTKIENVDPSRWSTGLANARLIAAAPELLESLQRILAQLDKTGAIKVIAVDSALRAIAKATGEPL